MIVRPVRSRLLPHATGLAGLAVLLFAVACEAPAPTQLRPAADPGGEAAPDLAPLSPEAQEVQELARRVSFRGDGRPLVVVDGARSDLTLDELGPSRVRRIEVLRGDAAVRRFGPEGAAGVVFVWTSDAPSAPTLGNAMDDYAPARDDGPGYAAEKKGDDASPKRVRFTGLPDDVELFVDGEPFEGELADLDPDRIDRIEVLKGERGGQVFITLK